MRRSIGDLFGNFIYIACPHRNNDRLLILFEQFLAYRIERRKGGYRTADLACAFGQQFTRDRRIRFLARGIDRCNKCTVGFRERLRERFKK